MLGAARAAFGPAPTIHILHALFALFPYRGELESLAILVGMATLTLAMVRRAARGAILPPIRALPALEALDDAVGEAAELGRPVHVTTGVEDARSPQTIAAFPVLRHTAERSALYGTQIVCTSSDPTVQAVNEEVVRQGFARAGHPEGFQPDDVRYLSDSQFAYAGAITGIFRRERPAVNVMVGAFNAEAMVLIEAGAEAGARQIGATSNIYQIPFIVAGCDHALIGEEMFAGAALLTGDRLQHASLVAQDGAKVALMAVVAVGSILAALGGLPR